MKKRNIVIGLIAVGAALCFCGFLMDLFGPEETSPEPIATSTPRPVFAPTPGDIPTLTATSRPKPSATPKSTPPTEVYQWRGVEIGTPIDDVLGVWGKPLSSKTVGQDRHGAIGEWIYEDVVITIVRWKLGGIECYRVWKMHLR